MKWAEVHMLSLTHWLSNSSNLICIILWTSNSCCIYLARIQWFYINHIFSGAYEMWIYFLANSKTDKDCSCCVSLEVWHLRKGSSTQLRTCWTRVGIHRPTLAYFFCRQSFFSIYSWFALLLLSKLIWLRRLPELRNFKNLSKIYNCWGFRGYGVAETLVRVRNQLSNVGCRHFTLLNRSSNINTSYVVWHYIPV